MIFSAIPDAPLGTSVVDGVLPLLLLIALLVVFAACSRWEHRAESRRWQDGA